MAVFVEPSYKMMVHVLEKSHCVVKTVFVLPLAIKRSGLSPRGLNILDGGGRCGCGQEYPVAPDSW